MAAITGVAQLSEWAREIPERASLIVREFAADVMGNVQVGGEWGPGTPVDWGFAAGSWIPSIGAPDFSGPDRPPNPDERYPLTEFASVVAGAQAGDVIYYSNNAVYIRRLEHGHSGQAPSGMVGVVLANGQAILDAATARVRAAEAEVSA